MRLPMKPGQTLDTTAIFPIRFASSMTLASCDGPVFAPRTTSSSRMTLAGEKKCRPMTASGRAVSAAITSMSSRLVFDARIAPGLATASSWRNTSCLTAMFSNTASMIRSHGAKSWAARLGVSKAIACSTSACVRRPRLTARS
jgi:hypothetical protein